MTAQVRPGHLPASFHPRNDEQAADQSDGLAGKDERFGSRTGIEMRERNQDRKRLERCFLNAYGNRSHGLNRECATDGLGRWRHFQKSVARSQ